MADKQSMLGAPAAYAQEKVQDASAWWEDFNTFTHQADAEAERGVSGMSLLKSGLCKYCANGVTQSFFTSYGVCRNQGVSGLSPSHSWHPAHHRSQPSQSQPVLLPS